MASKVTVDIPVAAIMEEFRTVTDKQQQRIAEYIATTTRKNLAVMTGIKTGNLRRSVKAMRSKYDKTTWIATVQAPHAHWIEYGHFITARGAGKKDKVFFRRSGKGGAKVGHVAARPFFRPAVLMAEANMERIMDVNNHLYVHKGIHTKGYKA